MKKTLLVIVTLILSLTLSACTGMTEQRNADDSQDTKGITEAPRVVQMKGLKFSPSSISVKKGESVTFENDDNVVHTVTAMAGNDIMASFNSGDIIPGQSIEVVFNEMGTWRYYCIYHPNMTGTISVLD